MKPIVHAPQTVLVTPAKTVTAFDKRFMRLVEDMTTTLLAAKNPKGVGLAAPQIGQPYRVFLTKPTESSSIRVFVNPEIIDRSEELGDVGDNRLEGCLSIPKVWGKVKRPKTVTLRFQDEHGTQHEETFRGFTATIIEHETDHTNGILFTQRVLEQHGNLYQAAKDKDGKEVLEEITI